MDFQEFSSEKRAMRRTPIRPCCRARPIGARCAVRSVQWVKDIRATQSRRLNPYEDAMFHFFGMLLIGIIAGGLAKLIMPGRDPGGLLVTTLLGIGGSLTAGFLGRAFGWYQTPGSGPGLIASVVGALILLAIYRLAIGRGLGRHDPRMQRPV
jgi:uncharacterized membrane protein YeaQ/YmgE (transglycosylase-associated protein family)